MCYIITFGKQKCYKDSLLCNAVWLLNLNILEEDKSISYW